MTQQQLRPQIIPKIIYTYYKSPDYIIRHIINTWPKDYKIIVLRDKDILNILKNAPLQFKISRYFNDHINYAKLLLLYNNGGIWIDSTTLIKCSLDFVHKYSFVYFLDKNGNFNTFFVASVAGNKYLFNNNLTNLPRYINYKKFITEDTVLKYLNNNGWNIEKSLKDLKKIKYPITCFRSHEMEYLYRKGPEFIKYIL